MTMLYIEPDAEAELENAAVRYEQSVVGLGVQFLAEHDSAFATCSPPR